ncbi:hypothetical protein M409DRAFT_21112 [Zasmidium cellare ATCC 36951]|uniref:2,5-diamino-6-ribosylamino-4(3H)-pyrimidinone 5'-phosphate reductase n=1 Tax=Zasmidium cellare ATCC 36951 TaxID=1080233 RepID=A0A6A6CQE8_ZASCE|nr:uncharacterized protein M409DRAFT_21112 [Zasmidium cellare ATCC 36951]KAF2168360.1 hypothetical protein M409DRAFT_21112 [Zasmidium cellare ATCC 36951]
MSETKALAASEMYFLSPFLPPGARNPATGAEAPRPVVDSAKDEKLPFVTLTYAQSLDGMIAFAPGQRTTISGPETKSMTHFLRYQHDAILVGVGTAVADDPALNCRYPGATINDQPRPVVVDPNLRFQLARSQMAKLRHEDKGKGPWLITRPKSLDSPLDSNCQIIRWTDPMPKYTDNAVSNDPIFWRSILEALKHKGINSVMIEGGASVIKDLLRLPELVDSIIITMAPTFIGQGGVSIAPRRPPKAEQNVASLNPVAYHKFGKDMVIAGRPYFPLPPSMPLTLNPKKTLDETQEK